MHPCKIRRLCSSIAITDAWQHHSQMLLTDAVLKDAAPQPSKMLAYATALTEVDFRRSKNIGLHYHPTYRYYKMLSSYPGKLFK
jgi:hypothetical protein